jgi:hypothetical protein
MIWFLQMHKEYLETWVKVLVTTSYQVFFLTKLQGFSFLSCYIVGVSPPKCCFSMLLVETHKVSLDINFKVFNCTFWGFEAKVFSPKQKENHFFKIITIAFEKRNQFSNQYIDHLWLRLVESNMYKHAFLTTFIGSYGAFLVDGYKYMQVLRTRCLKCNVKSIYTKYLICAFIFLLIWFVIYLHQLLVKVFCS